jgi:hypothetical protein
VLGRHSRQRDGDGVDIEARTWGSIHSKSKRCEPARVGFELALGEAVTAIQFGNCDLVRCWFNESDGRDFVARDRTGACEAEAYRAELRRGAPGSLTRWPSPSCLCMRVALSKQSTAA